MKQFMLCLRPTPETTILDVGGYPETWENPRIDSNITLLNIHPIDLSKRTSNFQMKAVVGDGCRLDYKDKEFDIVFSNSVIEHLGTWERQMAFAREMGRVGRALWIQTPARGFFMEPHLLTPLIHYFPRAVQKRLLRHFTVWGLITKPSPEQVEGFLNEVRLLDEKEMKQLFPGCEISKERIAGLTKSLIAIRKPNGISACSN